MSDITMEKKLELVQQIRSQYHKNQYDMSNREQILYGRTSNREEYMQAAEPGGYGGYNLAGSFTATGRQASAESNASAGTLSFRLRLLLALVLLAGVIVLDKNGTKIAGIAMEEVFQAISADYYEEIEATVNGLR